MCAIPDMPLWDVPSSLSSMDNLGFWDQFVAAKLPAVHRAFVGPHFLIARRRNHTICWRLEPDPSEIEGQSSRPRIPDGSWFHIGRERVRTLFRCTWTPIRNGESDKLQPTRITGWGPKS